VPRKPKRPCNFPGCPKLTDGRYCEEHAKVMSEKYNRYERPYDSSKRYGYSWRKIRNRYIKRNPFCEECKKKGLLVLAEEVHHILPLSKGGNNSETNLMSLCKSCHSRITAQSGDRWHTHPKEDGTTK